MRSCAKFGMPADPKQPSYGRLSLFPHYEALNHDRRRRCAQDRAFLKNAFPTIDAFSAWAAAERQAVEPHFS
jgi:hypothetical protein